MLHLVFPVEISSEGGQEFIEKETENFLQWWGVQTTSSAFSPSSIGRREGGNVQTVEQRRGNVKTAELVVKTAKYFLVDNAGLNGNNKMIWALPAYCKTPYSGCKLSPAQSYFVSHWGTHCLPFRNFIDLVSSTNIQFSTQWQGICWLKEKTMKAWYVKIVGKLSQYKK